MFDPAKGHAALRRGRWSIAGATYFLTFCPHQRQTGLSSGDLGGALLNYAISMTEEWHLRTAVVMPDHIHLVAELRSAVNLADAVRQFKGPLSVRIRKVKRKWQRGYYDHRLRRNENLLPIFLYVFLNPYRAGLVPADQSWPGYYCTSDDWNWFGELTKSDCPYPEWIS